jgi:hypothetical protein
MNQVSRLATTVLVSGGLGLAGVGLGAGIAHANEGPYQWCPGHDPGGHQGLFNSPADARRNWHWGVCHTYLWVPYGRGNVSPAIWEGDNPPPPAPWEPPNMCWLPWNQPMPGCR